MLGSDVKLRLVFGNNLKLVSDAILTSLQSDVDLWCHTDIAFWCQIMWPYLFVNKVREVSFKFIYRSYSVSSFFKRFKMTQCALSAIYKMKQLYIFFFFGTVPTPEYFGVTFANLWLSLYIKNFLCFGKMCYLAL